MKNFLRKNTILILLLLTAFGFFLRSYHFADWLHFELDQSRDARVIDRAIEGDALDLPLQGPKAGGTSLRLGPVYYYFQYVSGLVFGATPSGIAVIVMLFSVASIPLFFLFIRRYFGILLSIGLTAIFSSSAFLTMYGRFAWNPNPLPFFVLLGMYALLRVVDREEEKKGLWLSLSAISFTIATQLHFLAFVALPVIVGLFLLIRRPKISWKKWAVACGMIVLLYVPVILNDIETGGKNAENFFKAVTEKNSKGGHTLWYKGYKDITETTLGYFVTLSGNEKAEFPKWQRVIGDQREFVCDSDCRNGFSYALFMGVVLFVGIVFALFQIRQRGESRRQEDFVLLCFLWFWVAFFLFLPLSTSIAPRFFLLVAPLAFILFGFFVEALRRLMRRGRVGYRLGWFLVFLMIFSNLWSLWGRFDELSRAGVDAIRSAPDRILKEQVRVTLEQEDRIVSLMKAESDRTGYPVYMWSEPQYRRAFKYLMERKGMANDVLGFSDAIYREGLYYLILRTHSDREDALRKHLVTYDLVREVPFGTLVLIELSPKKELDIPIRQKFSKEKPPTDSTDLSPRYTWREFFLRQQAQKEDDEE